MPGIPFFLSDEGEKYIRINFTYPKIEEISKGIQIICDTIKCLQKDIDIQKNDSINEIVPIY